MFLGCFERKCIYSINYGYECLILGFYIFLLRVLCFRCILYDIIVVLILLIVILVLNCWFWLFVFLLWFFFVVLFVGVFRGRIVLVFWFFLFLNEILDLLKGLWMVRCCLFWVWMVWVKDISNVLLISFLFGIVLECF